MVSRRPSQFVGVLDGGPLVRVLAQIPARQPSLMRKQRVHTSPGLRWIEGQRSLAVLLQHGSVVIHSHPAIGVTIGRLPHPQEGVVQTKRQQRRARKGDDRYAKQSQQPLSTALGLVHAAKL